MFKVFYATTPLFSAGEAKELTNVKVVSFRNEINSLGSASLEWMTQDYSSKSYVESAANRAVTPFKIGDWIAIVNTDSQKEEIKDLQCTDSNLIIWWGYISSFQQEWQKDFKEFKGTLSCYEFGHFLNTQMIDYKNTYQVGMSIENGFNPKTEKGQYLGNFSGDPDLIRFGEGTPSTTDTAKFWKVKDAFSYITKKACKFEIEADFSGINFEKHSFLNNIETVPSYQGETLLSVIDDLLEPLKVAFRINSTSYISAYLVDTSAPNSKEGVTYSISPSTFNLQVITEEEKYDRVVLRGDRILVGFSTSTYKPTNKKHGLEKAWQDSDVSSYVKPLNFLDSTSITGAGTIAAVNILDFEEARKAELDKTVAELDDEKAKARAEEDMQDKIQYLLKVEDSARKLNKTVYQKFNWTWGDVSNTGDGNILFTSNRPGDIFNDNTFPVFPQIIIQKEDTPEQEKAEDTIIKSLLTDPEIIKKITNATANHQTPIASELKFEDWIPVSKEKNKETCVFIRSVGITTTHADTNILQPVWLDITSPSFNSYSAEVEVDWSGVRLKLPYPEVLSCGYDDIFRDPYSQTSLSDVVDYGFKRNDWEGAAGASQYDPYRMNYIGKGHWGRIVVSLSGYSQQKLEVSFGPLSGKTKIVEDTDFKFHLLRKGLVYQTQNFHYAPMSAEKITYPSVLNGLEYLTEDKIIRNDTPEMIKQLKVMWDYYSKDKKAIRIEDRIFDENGKTQNLKATVGDYWSKIKDNTATLAVNSYVASIEYLIENTSSPRVIISTEYPSSPVRTRNRKIKWGSKK